MESGGFEGGGKRKEEKKMGGACTYHGPDVGMWDCVKLVEFEFEVGTDINICALVFGRVTVFGGREY